MTTDIESTIEEMKEMFSSMTRDMGVGLEKALEQLRVERDRLDMLNVMADVQKNRLETMF